MPPWREELLSAVETLAGPNERKYSRRLFCLPGRLVSVGPSPGVTQVQVSEQRPITAFHSIPGERFVYPDSDPLLPPDLCVT